MYRLNQLTGKGHISLRPANEVLDTYTQGIIVIQRVFVLILAAILAMLLAMEPYSGPQSQYPQPSTASHSPSVK
jgi:hypothetical protein